MKTQQSEALRLADEWQRKTQREADRQNSAYDRYGMGNTPETVDPLGSKMVAELRTQHARITELESQLAQRFDAADMATASAQGFRDGVAKGQQAMWRHIETAPKDGSYLLLWEQYSDAPFVGYWSGGSWSVSHEHVDAEGGWDGANVVDALSMPITHWMPLPPAPGPADGESK